MYAKYNKETLWGPSILRFTRRSSSHVTVAMEGPLVASSHVFYNLDSQRIHGALSHEIEGCRRASLSFPRRGSLSVGRTSSFNLEDEYDRLADLVEAHLDWPTIFRIVEEGGHTA